MEQEKKESWARRHPVLNVLIWIILILFVIWIFSPKEPSIQGQATINQSFYDINQTSQDYEQISKPEVNNTPKPQEEKETQTEVSTLKEYNTVIRVIDGDTIDIDTGERVRLICIDSPEYNEEGYQQSKGFLENLILNKEVELVKDISETDRYGRLLRYVYTKDGVFVNELMVFEGYAEAFPYDPDTKLCPQIIGAEKINIPNITIVVENKTTGSEEKTQESDSCVLLGCPAGTKYAGSKKSDKYHYCNCTWAKKIYPENLLCFKSKQEAESLGYVPCKVCKP